MTPGSVSFDEKPVTLNLDSKQKALSTKLLIKNSKKLLVKNELLEFKVWVPTSNQSKMNGIR